MKTLPILVITLATLGIFAMAGGEGTAGSDSTIDPWEEVDTAAFRANHYTFTLYDWNRRYTIVQTPQCLTITLSIDGESDRTHTAPGVDAKLGALVRSILESGHCPTPIDCRACVECEGAGCAWGKYEWYMWFPEEESHSVNAFNDLNEYVFAITPEWKGIPAFFGYSPTPPEHVQAQGLFPYYLQNMILRTGCALRLDVLRARLQQAGYSVRELEPAEMGPVTSLAGGEEARALRLEKDGRTCEIYYTPGSGDSLPRACSFWDFAQDPSRADRWCNELILPL